MHADHPKALEFVSIQLTVRILIRYGSGVEGAFELFVAVSRQHLSRISWAQATYYNQTSQSNRAKVNQNLELDHEC